MRLLQTSLSVHVAEGSLLSATYLPGIMWANVIIGAKDSGNEGTRRQRPAYNMFCTGAFTERAHGKARVIISY